MGTRGCVCWRMSNGEWQGVFNHYDSYPTGLGQEVYYQVRAIGMRAVIAGCKEFRRWEDYINDEKDEIDDIGFIDPRKDPLYMEWVYLLDHKRNAIEVYCIAHIPTTKTFHGAREQDDNRFVHVKVADIDMTNPPSTHDWSGLGDDEAERLELALKIGRPK